MPTDNVVPFLSSDNSGDDLALARKLYDNRVAFSFRQSSKIMNISHPFFDRRSVKGAAAFQYYMFGQNPDPEKEYQSGDEPTGQNYALDKGEVGVDDIILAHNVVGEKDSIVSHINVLPELGKEHGRKVAIEIDQRLLNQHAMAARQPAASKAGLVIHNGGLRVTRSGGSATVGTALATAFPKSAAGAANFVSDLRDLAYLCDVNQWPEPDDPSGGGRFLICDAYLRQVMQFHPNYDRYFSKEYQDKNSGQKRRIMEIEGWSVLFWEKRASQGGLLPDQNITSYTKSTKFNNNFTPAASTGYPAVMAFGARSEEDASVGIGTWKGMTSSIMWREWKHDWLAQFWCLMGIEKMKPYSAATIEITL